MDRLSKGIPSFGASIRKEAGGKVAAHGADTFFAPRPEAV